ncbi:hypothetical protein STIAU_0152, partial [Stigmatella aurantiaca DW4/3-1]
QWYRLSGRSERRCSDMGVSANWSGAPR